MYPNIIVELGINHQGDVRIAEEMMRRSYMDLSGYPGRVYWKLQKRDPDVCVPDFMKSKPRESLKTGKTITYLEYKYEMEFGEGEYMTLLSVSKELTGLYSLFMSVWDAPSVAFISSNFVFQMDMPYIKIPSALITNQPLIKYAASLNIPLILSTGGSTKSQIASAVAAVPPECDLTILSCTSTYPCPDIEINLLKMVTLQELYGDRARIGFSSHSVSPLPAIYAAILGAKVVEVHYTLDRAMKGSDHAASLESAGLRLIGRELARIPDLLGTGELTLQPGELEKIRTLRVGA